MTVAAAGARAAGWQWDRTERRETMGIKEDLDAIDAFEEQIESAERVSEQLDGVEDPQYVPAVLAMLERNAAEDDFGVFGAFANYIEQFDGEQPVAGSTVGQLLAASVKRMPMWKTCELLPGFVDPDEAARVLTEVLGNDGLTEDGLDCARSALEEIVDSYEDELSEPVLAAARTALGS